MEAGGQVAAHLVPTKLHARRGGGLRALAAASLLMGVALAGGVPAADRGAVRGVVRIDGPVPPARPPVTVVMDPDVCGATVPDESLVLGAGGAVRDAVVILRGAPPPATPPAGEIVVDNRHCRFVPRVQVVVRGQTVRVRNSDAVLHNARPVLLADPEMTIANLALGVAGQSMELTPRLAARLPPTGEATLRLGCDVHPWMRGWLVVVDHPWAAVTDAEGRFALDRVPPGRYTLAVWHETLGRREQPVSVAPGETVRVDIGLPVAPP